MIGIAACAGLLFLLREAPIVPVVVGPIAGSLWQIKKGGNGLNAGAVTGAVTWVCVGLIFLVLDLPIHRPLPSFAAEVVWVFAAIATWAIAGALIGLAEGVALRYLFYLASLPRRLRFRAKRSAQANLVGTKR
jgi:Na+/proline symporter